jgi:hypothetical protein
VNLQWALRPLVLCGPPRGSRAGRFREGRLRRALTYGTARARILVAARPQPTDQGARPQGPRSVSGLRRTRSRCGVDQVGKISRLIPLGIAEAERADADPLVARFPQAQPAKMP